MSKDSGAKPIIVKRKKVAGDGGHHGGAWKVAYADFVTAMMAFFMLMWLLNATTEKQRKGLADYFSPTVPISRVSGGGDGVFSGDTTFTEDDLPESGRGALLEFPSESNRARGATGVDSENQREKEETEKLNELERQLMARAGESELLQEKLKHVITRLTDEGLVIELTDVPGAPLFDSATSTETALMLSLVELLSGVVNSVRNKVAVRGHVAAAPLVMARDTSWELSADRADRTREMLQNAGVEPGRMVRVSGVADRKPLLSFEPMAVRNNRIEVVVLRTGRD